MADGTLMKHSQSNHVLIRPTAGLRGVPFRELWAYRELLYFFTWRDIKVRYKQTVLGAAWAVLQPLLLMIVFTVFLGRLAGVSSEGLPYPIFAYAALVPWTMFSQAITWSSNSLVMSAQLISKVYFPRLLLPISSASSLLVDFGIAMILLIGMLFFYGFGLTAQILWIIPLTFLAFLTALAVGIFLSAANVKYRDVRYAVPFLMQLWLFASPVAYSAGAVPAEWQTIYGLNPMAGVVEGFRWALLGTPTKPDRLVFLSVLITAALLLFGIGYFRRVERVFADVI